MKKDKKASKKYKFYSLNLTKLELAHLRDLFTIALPTELTQTVSQGLANAESRPNCEIRLWNKVIDLCNEANLATGDEAPDFIVTISGPAPLSVYQVAHEEEASEDPFDTGE